MTAPGITGDALSTPPTSPIFTAPSVIEDPLLSTLPGAVIAQQESPAVMRIGVVAAIVEGSQITVRISGSDVLIDCSYLFNQYWPLLGDRVIVMKQDSQWVCLGQMSGAIGSNNALYNPSFEIGTPPGLPDGWTLSVGLTGAGTPTFEVATPGTATNISGVQFADFGTDSIGAGYSTAEAYSTSVPTTPDTKWTAAYFLPLAYVASLPPMYSDLALHIQFLDPGGTVIASEQVDYLVVAVNMVGPLYRRLDLAAFPDGFVVAPPGTASARIAFVASFDLPASSFVSFFIDNVILRQVD